jgi:hypothetical protein
MTDASELLDRFKKDLPNQGTWYWDEKTGTKARLLVYITKMLKAGMSEEIVKEIVIDMMFTGYVEHERQVKAKTGLSVREFFEQKKNVEPAVEIPEERTAPV